MNNKKICCIADTGIMQKVMVLLEEIQSRINLAIPLIGDKESVIDYDVVMFVLSNGTYKNSAIQTRLKEASDLNKVFVPIIIGGNWIANRTLIFKYDGPNLRTSFLQLMKEQDMYEFYKIIASYGGTRLSGDPIGGTVTILTDTEVQILRNNEIIGETVAHQSTEICLAVGIHTIQLLCKNNKKLFSEFEVSIESLSDTANIKYDFFIPLSVKCDMDSILSIDDVYVTNLKSNEVFYTSVLKGRHKIEVKSTSSSHERKRKIIIDTENVYKNIVNINLSLINSRAQHVLLQKYIIDNISNIQQAYYKGKIFAAAKYIVDGLGYSWDESKQIVFEIFGNESNLSYIKQDLLLDNPYIQRNLSEIRELYYQGKNYAAAQYIVNILGCPWNTAIEHLHKMFKGDGGKRQISNPMPISFKKYIIDNKKDILYLHSIGRNFAARKYFVDAYSCSWAKASEYLNKFVSEYK